MILSRVFPTLTTLKHVIKLGRSSETRLISSSRLSILKHVPAGLQLHQIRAMSNIEEELRDPMRHFDYSQLVAKKKENNVVIIDVREDAEIKETGKIPGSIHIPLYDLNHALNAISNEEFFVTYNAGKPKKEDEIIFTCRSGRRSLSAMRFALESGYTKARNYKGGWLDWAENTKNTN